VINTNKRVKDTLRVETTIKYNILNVLSARLLVGENIPTDVIDVTG